MLRLPNKIGYMIEWETDKTFTNGKPVKDSRIKTTLEDARKVKKEMERAGYKNVIILECIY